MPQSILRFIQAITTDIDADTAAMASCNFRALRFHGFPNQFLGLSYYVYYYFDDVGDWNANFGTEPDTDNVGQIISTSLDQVTSKIASFLTKLTPDGSGATINGTISNSTKLRPCKMAMDHAPGNSRPPQRHLPCHNDSGQPLPQTTRAVEVVSAPTALPWS